MNSQSPQMRDRRLQIFLAQARGVARNGDLLRAAFDRMLDIRRMQGHVMGVAVVEDALIVTLSAITGALDRLHIPYAVTGSVASSVHGEPVMSMDVDLVVIAPTTQAQALSEESTPRFYAPGNMLQAASAGYGFANVVDNETGMKADLSFVDSTTFPGTVLARRQKCRIGSTGPEFWFVISEDIILMKLHCRRETQSTKQWDNALSVARVRGARMDWKYLFEQARDLGLDADLVKLRDEAGI